MAARKNRQREVVGPGWLATLGGVALLLVLGFGVGLLAGALWEEPELVMDHLAGRTTELPLVAETSASPPKVEKIEKVERRAPTSRPLGARRSSPAAPSAEVSVELPSVSAKPPVARPAPPKTAGFEIQVGAFGDRGAAAGLAGKLRAGGFSVHVLEEDGPRDARFRVRVGPVRSRAEAQRLAGKLQSEHELPTWILSQDSR